MSSTLNQSEAEVEILMSATFSSMARSWSEYLCLESGDQEVVLSSRGYEVLGEASKYEVETDAWDFEYRLPESIDGKEVEGIEAGEFVVGGCLVPHDDDAELTLTERDMDAAKRWLSMREWDSQQGFEHAWTRIAEALERLPGPESEST